MMELPHMNSGNAEDPGTQPEPEPEPLSENGELGMVKDNSIPEEQRELLLPQILVNIIIFLM